MNSTEIIILFAIIFIGVVGICILIIKKLKNKIKFNEQLKLEIPIEVIKDFYKAESLNNDSMGEKTPQEILFEVWKEKNKNPIDKPERVIIPAEEKVEPEKPNKINLKNLFKK